VIAASGPPAARSPASLRAVSESRAPADRSSRASAAPIPSDAPVISATLPSIRMRALPPGDLKRNNSTMPSRLLPLFPLQVVVFPRTQLPLHIFEERYKEMVGEAIRDGSEFGIVLAREQGIVNTGCTVKVEKVLEMYPDGRMDIVTVGQRRFEIRSLDQDKDYLRAEVDFFDDDEIEPADEDLRAEAVRRYGELNALRQTPPESEPNVADPQLSFQLAQSVPDPDFLSALLRARSETLRLRELNQYLARYIPRQQVIERVRLLAPTNGHGGAPPKM
jgi:Lon protease-like protein